MNWDRIEGSWKQYMGKAREQWGKLTDSDWQVIKGKRDQLFGKVQERYGITREEAQKQADAWANALKESNEAEREHELSGRL